MTRNSDRLGEPDPCKSILRFDFQVILDYCYQTILPVEDDESGPYPLSNATVARFLGIGRAEVSRLSRDRGLTTEQADRYATRLGLHPVQLWTNFHDMYPEELPLEWSA